MILVSNLSLSSTEKTPLRVPMFPWNIALFPKKQFVMGWQIIKYSLRTIAGNTSHIKFFLILCIQFFMYMARKPSDTPTYSYPPLQTLKRKKI